VIGKIENQLKQVAQCQQTVKLKQYKLILSYITESQAKVHEKKWVSVQNWKKLFHNAPTVLM